jgi:anti-anti-sigma regulatory factor
MTSTPSLPDPAGAGQPIVLPANGTTVAAEDLQARFVHAADAHADMTIDASQVENVGQAMLQLLVAARAHAQAEGLHFAINAPSEAFLARVAACRLGEPLGLEMEKEREQ